MGIKNLKLGKKEAKQLLGAAAGFVVGVYVGHIAGPLVCGVAGATAGYKAMTEDEDETTTEDTATA